MSGVLQSPHFPIVTVGSACTLVSSPPSGCAAGRAAGVAVPANLVAKVPKAACPALNFCFGTAEGEADSITVIQSAQFEVEACVMVSI